MASRFPPKPTNSLFSAYDAQTRPQSNSPFRANNPAATAAGAAHGHSATSTPPLPWNNHHQHQQQQQQQPYAHSKKTDDYPPRTSSANAFAAYPGSSGAANDVSSGFRPASPNSKGQYSDAVLSELESQNDEGIAGLTGKVRMLKDLTTAIGTEIRESSSLAESMNRSFETTQVKLRGTMTRMLRMAERTGVGWKVWVLFFLAVWGLFFWVWIS